MIQRRHFLKGSLGLAALPALANWPQFRGPGVLGVVDDDPKLPESWSATENVAWKTRIPGLGWSCPVVWGDRIFLTTAVADSMSGEPQAGMYDGRVVNAVPTEEYRWIAYCVDLKSGKIVWENELHRSAPKVPRHKKNTYASETCVTDGEHVWAHVGDLGTYCLDMSGKLVWSKDWPAVETRYGYGTASSPALYKGRLYITNDSQEQSYTIALDKSNGKEIWRTNREEPTTWSTPFIWESGNRTEIITAGQEKVRSYDLDGKLLWEVRGMSSLSIPTPFTVDGLLYVTSGYVGSEERPVYAIRPGASGDISLAEGESSNEFIAWSLPQGGPYHPTPIVYQGLYYTLHDRAFMTCHDAKTGAEVYDKQRVSRDGGNFTASPWAYNGKLFCLDENGTTFVVQAGREFKVLGENRLEEMAMATPAIVDHSLLIRTYSTLYRITR
jgi:outer membrane protein assembly factor BamB